MRQSNGLPTKSQINILKIPEKPQVKSGERAKLFEEMNAELDPKSPDFGGFSFNLSL